MKKLNLCNGKYVLFNKPFDIDIYSQTLICFDDNFSVNNHASDLLRNSKVEKIIVIGDKPKGEYNKNVIFAKKITKNLLKDSEQVFFVINTDIDEHIIANLIKLKDICEELSITIGTRIKLDIVIGSALIDDEDTVVSLKAIFGTDSLYKRYEIIYDYICEHLDEEFMRKNICKFEDDKCIYNRHDKSKFNIMGCCYSFKYNGLACYNIALCKHLKNRSCDAKCLGCKLFTCKYLKERGIIFKLDYMIVAKGFFNKKQRELLRTTFFVTKGEVMEKLMRTM